MTHRLVIIVALAAIMTVVVGSIGRATEGPPLKRDAITRGSIQNLLRWFAEQDAITPYFEFRGDYKGKECRVVPVDIPSYSPGSVPEGGTIGSRLTCVDEYVCAGVQRMLVMIYPNGETVRCSYTCDGEPDRNGNCDCSVASNQNQNCPP